MSKQFLWLRKQHASLRAGVLFVEKGRIWFVINTLSFFESGLLSFESNYGATLILINSQLFFNWPFEITKTPKLIFRVAVFHTQV